MAHPIRFEQAIIVNEGLTVVGDVLIAADGTIAAVGGDLSSHPQSQGAEVIDARNQWLLPGCIDDQVHFREPGLTHKEDLRHATRACAKGGVTSFLEIVKRLGNKGRRNEKSSDVCRKHLRKK